MATRLEVATFTVISKDTMTKGIYLVANHKSQRMCENLVFSIRNTGCCLPIRIIHFGGKKLNSQYLLDEAQLVFFEDASKEAKDFINELKTVLTDCPIGFLYRYLAWFSDWDEFIYSDNDIVALCDWEIIFDYLKDYDLVHADEEYSTNGIFNYNKPAMIKTIFGAGALDSAITAGHIAVKKRISMISDFRAAILWFRQHNDIPQKHDQSFLHVSTLLGKWNMLNLCKTHNWLSSWAGDYRNSLDLIQQIQGGNAKISHIHYSGGTPNGDLAIQELLLSRQDDNGRMKQLARIVINYLFGYYKVKHLHRRGVRYLRRLGQKEWLQRVGKNKAFNKNL